tara:strand:+ start:9638 stop:12412 length:2775 start_codon:yes stop_codon:yes gene_type:complete
MNRRFFSWLFVVLTICSSPVYADEYDDTTQLEIVMSNISNQFVYAFFGKDMLIYYLGDSDEIRVVQEASDSQLSTLSKPFNAITGSLFMAGFTLIYGITLGYFIVRLAAMAIELGWVAQTDGRAQLSNQEQRGLLIKVVILGGLAITPIPLKSDLLDDTFYTSLSTVLVFDLLGKTSRVGDESMVSLIDSQRSTLKTLKMPAAESKTDSMSALNAFFTCARTQEGRGRSIAYDTSIPMYLDGKGKLQGQLSVGDCSLFVQLGMDLESDKKIAQIRKISPSLPLDEKFFLKAQEEVYRTLIPSLFSSSSKISEELVKPEYSSSLEDGDFSFKGHSSSELTVSELDRWPTRCDEVLSWSRSADETISRRDRIYLNYLSSRCLSRDVADSLVYPKSYDAISAYLGNASKAQKDIALCVDQASMTSILASNRFTTDYGLGTGDSRSSKIEQISLDACVSNLCSSTNVANGGMYACANALDLYQERLNDIKVQQRGVMMLGFYMFDVFIHHPPSASAKKVFNDFSISFSPTPSEDAPVVSDTPFMSFPITVPRVSEGGWKRKNLVLADLSLSPEEYGLPTTKAPLPTTGSLLSEAFGYTRLEACAKNPLQVTGGFVCGNIPREFSQFGMTVLRAAITLKTALIMGQTTGAMKRLKVNEKGTVEGYRGNDTLKSFVRKGGWTMVSFMGGDKDSYYGTFDSVFNMELMATDEFGYLDSVKMNKLLSSAPALLLSTMAHVGATTGFVSIVDNALIVMLIIGALFAFVLPMFPMIMIMNAFVKWSFLLFKTIATHGKKLVDSAFDQDFDLLNESLDKVWGDLLALFLKLPLTVIGVVLAWLMSNVMISHILHNMNLMVPTNDGMQGVLDLFVSMLVSGVIILIVYNMILTIIESFYDFTVEWILGYMHNNPFSSDSKAAGWRDAKEVLAFMGR